MTSGEIARARQWYANLVAALTPADGQITPEQMRVAYDRVCASIRVPSEAHFEQVDVDGVSGCWVTVPESSSNRTILYLHPGGYAVGSVYGHRHVAAALARASAARVLAIDYRLAPENPHPAAVEDAATAYRFILHHGATPSSVAICGDSAGGGLAIATLLSLRDAGTSLPACGVAVSPWTDLALSGESMATKAGEDPVNSREMLGGLAMMYLAGADPQTPLASPLYGDLAGLPPLLVLAGSAEVLLDDAKRLAVRAQAAGVDVTLKVADDMVHIWTFFESFLPEAQAALDQIGQFVTAHCRQKPTADHYLRKVTR